ncbi:WRKY transcription factor [Actinidia chinensis var. chinensis]|uniref:WRKY transcription factor n=1 Tax=Actinidia chinensis var. chinensis TaxID=1590841 RepID=A0A2R6QJ15_ACTCC|nr:WRKY transcription factor [Actinidia chinensis var. chinensis]
MGEELPPNTNTNNNVPYLFTPSLPSTPLLNLPLEPQIDHLDIDWASLLSGTFLNGDHQNLQLPNVSSVSSTRINTVEGDNCQKSTKGKGSRSKKAIPPRVAFHTRSSEDVLDDGYRWRKYGQKAVKNSSHPRSYYRCTHHTCNVKKQIQRLSKDRSIVVTTYEGIHNHPCEKLMETLGPLLKQIQFLSRF